MPEASPRELWWAVLAEARWADALDVTLVAAFAYLCLSWLWQRSSRGVLLVALACTALFFTARVYDMQMTERVLETLLAVAVVAIVVIFHADFRRLFDRIAAWKLLGGRRRQRSFDALADVITTSATRLAEDRVGALIAIEGREDWERHIEGGVIADARPSETLLLSLFNTAAPGHDGAVLIESGRLARFAAHLPLSSNRGVLGEGGTRHAAALGLSELCDALVIVVSEERGTISLAHEGQLRLADDTASLREQIADFADDAAPARDGSTRWRVKLSLGLVALCLASLAWLGTVFEWETVTRTYTAPVELRGQPAELVLREPLPAEINVWLSGSEQEHEGLNPEALALSIDLAGFDAGAREIAVTRDMLRNAADLRFLRADPSSLVVKLGRTQEVEVPIKVQTTGKLAKGLRLKRMTALPEKITLIVPEGARRPRRAKTETVDLSTLTESTRLDRQVLPPDGASFPGRATQSVTVLVEIEAR